MKLTCDRSALDAALDVAMRGVATRSTTLPILGHVLFDARDDLTLTGTDLETRAWQTLAAEVSEPGSVALPPKALAALLAQSSEDTVSVSVGANRRAVISCGRAELKLPGLDAEEFPAAPRLAAPVADFTVSADILADAFGSVLHAVAPDASRPALSGVLMAVRGDGMELVAADGFRLARRRVALDTDAPVPEFSVIVQGRGLASAARSLPKVSDARLIVDAQRSMLVVETAAGSYAVRLLDETFPDFNRIIPRDPVYGLVVNRAALLGAIKLAEPVARDDANILRLKREADGALTVSAATEHENAASVIAADANDEGYPPVAYNASYLRQAVEAFGGNTVTLAYSRGDAAGTVHDGDTNAHLHVLMPMTTKRPS